MKKPQRKSLPWMKELVPLILNILLIYKKLTYKDSRYKNIEKLLTNFHVLSLVFWNNLKYWLFSHWRVIKLFQRNAPLYPIKTCILNSVNVSRWVGMRSIYVLLFYFENWNFPLAAGNWDVYSLSWTGNSLRGPFLGIFQHHVKQE
jgi:hypothetical protein